MLDHETYVRNKSKALMSIKSEYRKLESGLITYKAFKTKVKSIFRKYGCKFEIFDGLYYVEVGNKTYYIKTFCAGDFDIQFEIDINLVDFRFEECGGIEDIQKGDLLVECYAICIDDGSVREFEEDGLSRVV